MKFQIFQIGKRVFIGHTLIVDLAATPRRLATQRDMKSVKNITKSTSLIPQFRPTLLLLPPHVLGQMALKSTTTCI